MREKLRQRMRRARYIFYQETLFDYKEHFWTFVGSFAGIGLLGWLHSSLLSASDNIFLIASFGASSVLIYGIINSPLAQPRNLIGGHVLCALVGVTVQRYLPLPMWVTAALAVSSSIVLMQVTRTLHPPGGATALMAVIGSDKLKALGYGFVLCPVLTGVVILLLVAIVFNNATSHRSYPTNKHWYKIWQRRYS
ncbi:HPP family protein [Hymenobacter sediminis]|uniref:HPP family protein n=1 Tax=Hymenobacter sediminis TaxID=2218621 RepID=UPI000DA6B39F|nr:HPP family protein [Hymenobacter sediminis]RPD47115.1 HPP family protein [Hymenobacter sediminis]